MFLLSYSICEANVPIAKTRGRVHLKAWLIVTQPLYTYGH